MKKLAIISGLLFIVVFIWVNIFTGEDNSIDVVYPATPASTLTNLENPDTPVPADIIITAVNDKQEKESYLIVASFNSLEQASKMAEDYASSHQAEMFVLPPTSKGFYRVSYGKYSTTEEAKAALEAIRQTDFPDAWLLGSK